MSVILASNGNMRATWDESVVMGPYKPNNVFFGAKVYRTTNIDASGGVVIPWQYTAWDTGGFIRSLPTNNIVIPRNGWYCCIAYINTLVYTYHVSRIDILINGTLFDSERLMMNSSSPLMNANSAYMADRYCYAGDVITVSWDTNGVTGITLHNGGENGCSCTVWRTG
jgi:hypothetical protein